MTDLQALVVRPASAEYVEKLGRRIGVAWRVIYLLGKVKEADSDLES